MEVRKIIERAKKEGFALFRAVKSFIADFSFSIVPNLFQVIPDKETFFSRFSTLINSEVSLVKLYRYKIKKQNLRKWKKIIKNAEKIYRKNGYNGGGKLLFKKERELMSIQI